MKTRGASLVETLVGVLVATVASIGVYTFVLSLHSAQNFSVSMPTAQREAYEMATMVAGSLRRATLCTSTDTGCNINAAFQDGSATAITIYYRDGSTLVPVTYDVVNGAFRRTRNNTTTVIYDTGASLTLTYYKGSAYHASSLAVMTPDVASAPYTVAVRVDATKTTSGATAQYSTVVRLRMGPKKISPVE